MTKLMCPKCKKHPTEVYSTKSDKNEIVRYRMCSSNRCSYHFKTIEKIYPDLKTDKVIKKIQRLIESL